MRPAVSGYFDAATSTISYLVADPESGRAAIVDPVRDFDAKSGRLGNASADRLIAEVEAKGLNLDWIFETHVHADHLSAAPYVQERLGGKIAIGARITEVQATFAALFNIAGEVPADGSQFDRLFDDEETFSLGSIPGRVLHSPGHTPACAIYLIGDAAFVGDTIFMPDFGSARCDFPGGSAATLYRSIQRLFALPPQTRLFMCHDYMPGGRDLRFETTVAEQRAENIHLHDGIGEAEFVAMRSARDAKLSAPALILPAIQVNIRAGRLPAAEANGIRYLRLPLDSL